MKTYGKFIPAAVAVGVLLMDHFYTVDLGPVSSDIVVLVTAVGGLFEVRRRKAYG